ncbi:unnamed protein product [Eruca vesicaria subsp. sativa]|uniref:CBS domain-containing protein n=1 Tax=Eruca vesicaria subsp. sativa TaxID=29727 RepID=A0ABC8K6K7_ERUVS|nr:unnamed protein product [Eruca vesicaria subsp. sativa]
MVDRTLALFKAPLSLRSRVLANTSLIWLHNYTKDKDKESKKYKESKSEKLYDGDDHHRSKGSSDKTESKGEDQQRSLGTETHTEKRSRRKRDDHGVGEKGRKELHFLGLLTLSDIQEFSKGRKEGSKGPKEILVNDIYSMSGGGSKVSWTVTPDMDLLAAQTIMNKHEISHVPVVSGGSDSHRIHPVGVLDKECITVTRRALATRMQKPMLPFSMFLHLNTAIQLL